MYAREAAAPPSGNAFAMACFKAELEEPVEVWPEHWAVLRLFRQLETQWRIGLNGPTGLDYCAVYPLLDRMNLSPDQWELMLEDLQTLEVAAIEAMRENQ